MTTMMETRNVRDNKHKYRRIEQYLSRTCKKYVRILESVPMGRIREALLDTVLMAEKARRVIHEELVKANALDVTEQED